MSARKPPMWPVIPLALPAAVSIWAGWVGLGGLTGFGVVQLLPGIWDGLRVNTAVTLPIGMEAYAAYALHCWLHRGTPRRAKDFARVSSIAALVLGALGQVAYHLMAASGVQHAPWQIVALVACLPVGTLGMGATLAHLLSEDDGVSAVVDTPGGTRPVGTPNDVAPPVAPFRPAGSELVRTPGGTAPNAQQDRHFRESFPEVADPPAVVTGRPDPSPAIRSADRSDRSADRSTTPARTGPARKRTGRPRTDADLSQAVRELAEQTGSPPSTYALKQALGVGSQRAARLLAELDTTPAGSPASNGAATRREGTR